ncbi:hypothetical protein Daus18300_009914 [Diaporthe australafricana]|uniref:RfeD n=1 Tax=Diaporthe australafricana TaxID=127596 RepID=A0ABR3WCP8_9PEZI
MLLKRKRSDDQLSPFSSSSPLRANIAADVATLDMDVDMDMDTDMDVNVGIDNPLSAMTIRSPGRSSTPSHLPSRTFKRLRNGRPSEHEVHRKSSDGAASSPYGPFLSWGMFPDSLLRHVRASTENTLQMLYRAQHRSQHPQHVLSPPPPTTSPAVMPSPTPTPSFSPHSPAAPAQSQRSLHSFWNIPSKQPPPPLASFSSAPGPSVDTIVDRPTSCDDCGVGLGGEDAAVDDGYGFETYISSCSMCCKSVCFSCSVSNLGEQRRCLVCAGKEDASKGWVGAAGWSSEPMSVY